MNEELDYTDEAALALEEWDTLEVSTDTENAMDDMYEDIEDSEDGDLFDILERGRYA